MSNKKVVIRIVISLILSIVSLGIIQQPQTATAQSFSLVWSDEFNGAGNTGVNTGNWMYDTGTCYPGCPAANWGTGEVESMTTSTANVFQDGAGHLVIKAINSGGAWTGGRIETQRTDFQPPAGGIMRVEASIQQPNVSGAAGAGYWPAFWMLGAPFRGVYTNWPGIGEIDILEDINGRSSVFGTLHCGVAPGGPCNEFTGLGSGERACSGCQTGFHTYAVEYDRSVSPQQIRWYLDGANYFTINANQVDATTWNNATNHGFFIILNLAMGGSFPGAFGGGPTGSTVSGGAMVVDYVRVSYSGGPQPTSVPQSGPPGYTLCAAENGTCSFSGTATVAYGANGTFNFKAATNSIGCNNNTFGDPISGVAKSCYYLASGSGPAGYTYCIGEGGTCSFSGTATVAYGANGAFNYKTASNSIACNNATFNDPISGVAKSCYYLVSGGGPAGYTFCTNENGTCSFSGTASVAYGANGAFNYKTATNSIPCNNTTFGDPIVGTAKACYYQLTAAPTPTFVPGASAWQPNTAYSVGQQVTYAGLTYKCLQAHTSQVGWEPPNVPALWQKV